MPKADVVIIVDTVAVEAQSVIVDVNMLLHTSVVFLGAFFVMFMGYVFRVVTVIFGLMGQEIFHIIRLRALYMYRCSDTNQENHRRGRR